MNAENIDYYLLHDKYVSILIYMYIHSILYRKYVSNNVNIVCRYMALPLHHNDGF